MSKKNTNKRKNNFNLHQYMNKNRKKIIGCISAIIVLTLVGGIFAQFAYASF